MTAIARGLLAGTPTACGLLAGCAVSVVLVVAASVITLEPAREFVYDDTILVATPDVRGTAPFGQLWTNDFWGMPLSHPDSHKSHRCAHTTLHIATNTAKTVGPYTYSH